MTDDEPPSIRWPAWVLIGCAVWLAANVHLLRDRIVAPLRFQVVGLDAQGDVIVFDNRYRRVLKITTPTIALDTVPLF